MLLPGELQRPKHSVSFHSNISELVIHRSQRIEIDCGRCFPRATKRSPICEGSCKRRVAEPIEGGGAKGILGLLAAFALASRLFHVHRVRRS